MLNAAWMIKWHGKGFIYFQQEPNLLWFVKNLYVLFLCRITQSSFRPFGISVHHFVLPQKWSKTVCWSMRCVRKYDNFMSQLSNKSLLDVFKKTRAKTLYKILLNAKLSSKHVFLTRKCAWFITWLLFCWETKLS